MGVLREIFDDSKASSIRRAEKHNLRCRAVAAAARRPEVSDPGTLCEFEHLRKHVEAVMCKLCNAQQVQVMMAAGGRRYLSQRVERLCRARCSASLPDTTMVNEVVEVLRVGTFGN